MLNDLCWALRALRFNALNPLLLASAPIRDAARGDVLLWVDNTRRIREQGQWVRILVSDQAAQQLNDLNGGRCAAAAAAGDMSTVATACCMIVLIMNVCCGCTGTL